MNMDEKVLFPCPYLNDNVVFTPERHAHILEEHANVIAKGNELLQTALLDPIQVRLRPTGSLLFVIQVRQIFLVVAVNKIKRDNIYKIMTAYFARKLSKEDSVLWEK